MPARHTLFAGEAAGEEDRLLVRDLLGRVDEREVGHVGDEARTDALDLLRPGFQGLASALLRHDGARHRLDGDREGAAIDTSNADRDEHRRSPDFFAATLSEALTNPWGKQVRAARVTGKIARQDFGLTGNKTLDQRGMLVGDEVSIDVKLELNEHRSKSPDREPDMIHPIFVSHGAPTLPFEDAAARYFLEGLAATLPRPRAILVVSAHWETRLPEVGSVVARYDTIHDFYGFPDELYRLTYPAPGDPALADRVVELLGDAGSKATRDRTRGLDHGAWVPLMLAWPAADVPVVQLSVQSRLGPGHHLALGRALAPLVEEDVLILGSGSFTHDLSSWRDHAGGPEPGWVTAFADWLDAALRERRTDDLLDYRRLAPHAVRNHPTEEHLLPLFVALGARGADAAATRLHTSNAYGILRMDAYAFRG